MSSSITAGAAAPRRRRAPGRAELRGASAADDAGDRGAATMIGNGTAATIAANDSAGDRPAAGVFSARRAEAMRRLHDDRDHRRLDGGEGAGTAGSVPKAT